MKQFPVKSLLLLFFSGLITFYSNAQVKTLNGKTISTSAIDQVIKKAMDSASIPGASVVFFNNGKIVYQKAYGYANLEKKIPANESTVFEACSISKPVFAYFIMRMADRGIIALDTPLFKYLTEPDIAYDERYKLITARMVLSHTTGFPNWRAFETPDSSLHVPKNTLWLKFTPGTQFSYSGEGFQYLVRVITNLLHTTSTGLADIVDKEVCKPLQMAHSRFGWNDYIAKHKAVGYEQVNDNGINKPGGFNKYEEFNAAGGLHTDPADLAKFLIAMANGKGLSKKSFTEMLRPQSKTEGSSWGLGIQIKDTPYGIEYRHTGDNGNFKSYSMIYKNTQSGFVLMVNSNRQYEIIEHLEPLFTEGKM
jgi:CubicO group peptidase (beta-lactamase class C family)